MRPLGLRALLAPLFQASNRQAIAYLLERGSNLVFTFLSGIIVLRSLGPGAFAVYGMVISVAQVCATFARLSLDDHYAFTYVSRHASARLTRIVIVQRALLGAGLGAAVGALFGTPLRISGLAPVLTIVAFCLLEALSVTEIQVQALASFRWLSAVGMTRSIVGLALRLGLLLTGRGTLDRLLVVALCELVVFRIGLHVLFRVRRLDAGRPVAAAPGVAEVRAFYAPDLLRGYLLTTVLALAYTRTELFFAGAGLDQDSLGTYLGAQRFVEVYAYLANVLGALLVASIARLPDAELGPYLARSTLRMGALVAAFVVANLTIVPYVLPLLVGHKFPELPRTFCVLSLSIVPLYVGTPASKILLARGRTGLPILGGAVSVLVCVVSFMWVFPASWGSLRPALAIAVGNVIGGALIVAGAWWTLTRKVTAGAADPC